MRITILGLAAGSTGCSRADVYPITRDPTPDGGAMDATGAVSGTGGQSGSGSGGGAGAIGGGAGANGGGGGATSACPTNTLQPGDSTRTVVVGSMTRSYILHVPPGYDGSSPVPLVLDFHGIGETSMSERSSSPYPAALDPEGVVMAFPEGLRGPAGLAWNVGPCCVADVDDVAFARALVAEVRGLACIDATRVYAVGVLTGGGMAHYLACHAADVFAGASPAAFDLLAENVDDCVPARPITVVSFRGTADSRVPYEGGPSSLVPMMPLTFLGARATFEKWGELNRCTGPASPEDPNGCSAYSGCAGGVEVVLCTKQDGPLEPGDPSIAWPVLERHTL
jgi:polyhydroxybutyrate depolymerase